MAPDGSVSFESSLEAPRLARQSIQEFLSLWAAVDGADDAALLTSELVTNAVRHATARIALRVLLANGLLRVEVTDGAPASVPRLRSRSSDGLDVGGYGLWLVDLLAERWGHHVEGDQKVVWFEVRCPR